MLKHCQYTLWQAPNTVAAEFHKTRHTCEYLKEIPREQRSTFHEIHALSLWLFKKPRFDNETCIKPPMAHSDPKMPERYQQGHEKVWITVYAELEFNTPFRLDKI